MLYVVKIELQYANLAEYHFKGFRTYRSANAYWSKFAIYVSEAAIIRSNTGVEATIVGAVLYREPADEIIEAYDAPTDRNNVLKDTDSYGRSTYTFKELGLEDTLELESCNAAAEKISKSQLKAPEI